MTALGEIGLRPRVLVVDGSRVARRLIEQVLQAELPDVTVVACGSGRDALAELQDGSFDFVTTALRLPDMDGAELARHIREQTPQAYIPIVVVSGSAQERLTARTLGDDVTDYFDKSLGFQALATFIRGYVHPVERIAGRVLYVEDSRVVALATSRILDRHGLSVRHVVSAEEAIAIVENERDPDGLPPVDLVLTDVSLKGALTGGDLLDRIRTGGGFGKGLLPVLVMTGDDNPRSQTLLLRAGANDLVSKPIDERLLVTKLQFQLRVSQHLRRHHRGTDA
ncbi:response regulator [Dokdonella koreensis]|uniref:Response regulator receiver protein n=1 Tax=Dokdonella koreensis DS-123 TaxID=1300342 RepID=A0A160DWM2_9GAMM|nr:response regulator [Dokdonella koreensis]ANB19038.1 Response regulator receiver protein [Dokdonella koreensis DS-123]